jgi:alpha-tubulin suppressor-like RCC1 family protein
MFTLSSGEKIVGVSLGYYHSSALTSFGRLFMWGYNYYGQLGDGTTTDSSTPIDITNNFTLSSGEKIESVSLGYYHSSALTSLGRLFMWGWNYYGQLGNGTTTDSSMPISIQIAQFTKDSEVDCTYQTSITPYTPIKAGYTFSGWFTNIEMTIPYPWGIMPANDMHLYGYWI